MARTTELSLETLRDLGADELARLVLAAVDGNPAFRRQVSAALAGRTGPEAVARLTDRRLAALEKAHGDIRWDKARAFRDDLAATVAVITGDLGRVSPRMGVDQLLRFIATSGQVLPRINDDPGLVEAVYDAAVADIGLLASRLAAPDLTLLPARIMAGNHGYLVSVAREIVPHLPRDVLRAWDEDLAGRMTGQEARPSASGGDTPAHRRWVSSHAPATPGRQPGGSGRTDRTGGNEAPERSGHDCNRLPSA